MKDSDIEDLLRKYRPLGPPARLRERIFAIDHSERIWPWATAAAALLVSALTFPIAIRYEAASVDVRLGPAAETRVVDDLTDRLGGDADARELAEFIVVEQQLRAEAIAGEPQ